MKTVKYVTLKYQEKLRSGGADGVAEREIHLYSMHPKKVPSPALEEAKRRLTHLPHVADVIYSPHRPNTALGPIHSIEVPADGGGKRKLPDNSMRARVFKYIEGTKAPTITGVVRAAGKDTNYATTLANNRLRELGRSPLPRREYAFKGEPKANPAPAKHKPMKPENVTAQEVLVALRRAIKAFNALEGERLTESQEGVLGHLMFLALNKEDKDEIME